MKGVGQVMEMVELNSNYFTQQDSINTMRRQSGSEWD